MASYAKSKKVPNTGTTPNKHHRMSASKTSMTMPTSGKTPGVKNGAQKGMISYCAHGPESEGAMSKGGKY
jgi:hypothetical protein